MINFWPTSKMEDYLNLKSRVQARMALADATATGHDDLLDQEESLQSELSFRDTQLKQLIENVPDLDDLDDSISMRRFHARLFLRTTAPISRKEPRRTRSDAARRVCRRRESVKRGTRRRDMVAPPTQRHYAPKR